ncbi:haloacid dehalogenase [Aerococcus christensenii]|uniref:Haloacid dehalogenase n=1 Tax=Aerococcus christensenii TaxID=87541 RepID=A0A2I1K7K8_9LACT|nr:HAD family phosphatase [Aerococcus christensenii]PKY91624.1 haloacid dehalogenase [Aerococcus christensenii]
MKKIIIFDMDGTLIDSETPYLEALTEVFKKYGISFTREEYVAEQAGRTFDECQASIIRKSGNLELGLQVIKETGALHQKRFEEEGFLSKPGLIETLEAIKSKGIKMMVASSSTRQLVDKRLKSLGIQGYFSEIVSGDQVSHSKPHPEIFLLALERSGCSAQEALIVEDSPSGVEAGLNAHIETIMVPDLVEATPKIQEEALAVVPDLTGILPYLGDEIGD